MMIGFQKRIFDGEFYLIHKLKGNFKCTQYNCKNVASIKVHKTSWSPMCEDCLKKTFYEPVFNSDHVFKNH